MVWCHNCHKLAVFNRPWKLALWFLIPGFLLPLLAGLLALCCYRRHRRRQAELYGDEAYPAEAAPVEGVSSAPATTEIGRGAYAQPVQTDGAFDLDEFPISIRALHTDRPTVAQAFCLSRTRPSKAIATGSPSMAYNNLVMKVTNQSTPDPWVTWSHGNFYLLFTAGDRVDIWQSKSLVDFNACTKKAVWRPAPNTLHDLWAPELHSFYGTWYIYVAAADPGRGNESHRMVVLRGPTVDQNPLDGPWELIGNIDGLPQTQWQIDGTVVWLNQVPYFVYSGWPIADTSGIDRFIQELYIVRLANAYQADSHPVRISTPEYEWEKSGEHAINEGPQYLESPDGRWRGLAYSCGASWNESYKMNTLRWTGGDPLSPLSWQKAPQPLLTEAPNTPHAGGPHGPGHGSFITLDHEVFCVYHAIGNLSQGWEDRPAHVQRVSFANGYPEMGGCIGPVVSSVELFTTGFQSMPGQQQFGQNITNQSGGHGNSQGTGHKHLDKFVKLAGDKLQKYF